MGRSESLENQVQDSGIGAGSFYRLIPYSQMPRYLAAAHAFITASVTEVHPLSVIEAMAVGLPILGIASPGIADTVDDEKPACSLLSKT
jgi:glycosyltransferase involved in cell wall biosynthesis